VSIHPDKTAYRAVDACGGVFPRAQTDYDKGFEDGHDAALSAASEAVKAVDELTADLLESLENALSYIERFEDVRDGDYGVPEPNEAMQVASDIRASIAKATTANSVGISEGNEPK